MEVVYRCCCGIDVHKKVIVACLNNGGEQDLREFGTTTSEIKSLAKWLTESGCEMIAMESTGVFWKPLYNLFELMDLDAIVVNAAHMKALPGRKTDVKDAEWIADLLRHGLLKASYIPSREQRELREITRYRKSLTEERCRETNRLQKILEGANIKLDSVVKDIMARVPASCWNGLLKMTFQPVRQKYHGLFMARCAQSWGNLLRRLRESPRLCRENCWRR